VTITVWHENATRASDKISAKPLAALLKPSPDSWEALARLTPGRREGRLATAKLVGLLRLHHGERETPLAVTTTTKPGDVR
jgi:hypothetical protein